MNSFEEELPYKFIRSEPGIFVEIYLPKKADFLELFMIPLLRVLIFRRLKTTLEQKRNQYKRCWKLMKP